MKRVRPRPLVWARTRDYRTSEFPPVTEDVVGDCLRHVAGKRERLVEEYLKRRPGRHQTVSNLIKRFGWQGAIYGVLNSMWCRGTIEITDDGVRLKR